MQIAVLRNEEIFLRIGTRHWVQSKGSAIVRIYLQSRMARRIERGFSQYVRRSVASQPPGPVVRVFGREFFRAAPRMIEFETVAIAKLLT